MENNYRELDIRSLTHSMFRKAKYFLFSYIIVAILLCTYLFIFTFVKPSYISSSIVYVSMKSDANSALNSPQITIDELSRMREITNTFLQVVKSNRLASKVVESLDLEVTATDFIKDNLKVNTIESTPFISISVKWDNSQTAYDINQAILDNITTVLKEMNISGTLMVVDGPIHSQKQNIPSNLLLAAIYIVAGFVGGFVCVLLNELLYSGFRTEEDIKEYLKLVNLGIVPKISRTQIRNGRNGQIQKKTEMVFLELLLNIRHLGKIFVINSAFAKENKNYVTVMLAKSAAEYGKKVLVIETDGVNDEIRKYIPESIEKTVFGLKDFHTDQYGFDISILEPKNTIGSDNSTLNVDGIFKTIPELEQKYDYIFIHNRPIELSGSACLLAPVGKSLLVISHEKTSIDAAVHAKRMLEVAGCEICGTVLTNVNSCGPFNYFSRLRRNK